MNYKYIFFSLLLLSASGTAQIIPIQKDIQQQNPPQLNYEYNRVLNGNLNEFYRKLKNVKETGSGVVTIVHIGDSHIQPDFIGTVLRNNLQSFFGDAGRGLVFPYQLAKSNAPLDLISSSNVEWTFNRLAHPEIPINCGISGFCIRSKTPQARINISLKDKTTGPQYFNRLRVFIDTLPNGGWKLEMNGIETQKSSALLISEDSLIILERNTNQFSLIAQNPGDSVNFYGVSLENDSSGVRFHTIGVNGAKYDQYNNSALFWKQLPQLNADLIIVSLGTNEAQKNNFDAVLFLEQVKLFVENLQVAFPKANVLITTPQDSYLGSRSNIIMRNLNLALSSYCQKNGVPLWDLYKITNGFGSARYWAGKGFMSRDRVHFNASGYKIQGKLLYNVLAQGYNDYQKSN